MSGTNRAYALSCYVLPMRCPALGAILLRAVRYSPLAHCQEMVMSPTGTYNGDFSEPDASARDAES
eukprot:888820-Rhodomonas_salina.2